MIPKFDELTFNTGYGAELLCPHCGFNYLHHDRVEVFERGEDAKHGVHVSVADGNATMNTDLAGNPSDRRHGLNVYFWCEGCDAVPVLSIAQHKGVTHVDFNYTLKDGGEEG